MQWHVVGISIGIPYFVIFQNIEVNFLFEMNRVELHFTYFNHLSENCKN